MDLPSYIGKKIKEFRKANGWSQERLAELLNTSQSSVQRWEKGGPGLGLDDLERIAGLGERPIWWFLPPMPETELQHIVEQLSRDPEIGELFQGIVDACARHSEKRRT